MGKPLYEKYGFLETAEIIRMKKDGPNFPSRELRAAPWRPGHSSNQIGPLITDSLDEAKSQLMGALATNPQSSWIIDVPTSAPRAWHEWLAAQEFIPQRFLIRMYRGHSQALPANVLATAGPEYGHQARSYSGHEHNSL